MDLCDLAGIVAVPRQRHETRMGFCLALAHGCGNLRDHSDRLRSRPPLALWPRTQRHGSSYWHHAGDHFHRFARRQDSFLAVGTFSPPTLGNRADMKMSILVRAIASGRSITNVAPLPSPALCARTLPPCISMIALLMARPRPRPSWCESTCSKASKILSRNCGSIPTPVSLISTMMDFGDGLCERTETVP